jgi:hypothetical protein
VDPLVAALIGVVVGALGSHLLTQQRERAGEERRARNICRLLFRDLMQIYFKVQSVVHGKPDQKWPPVDGIPFEIRVENRRTLGPDFTMVCRDADLWESVCIAFEEAEYLDTDAEIDRHRLEKALSRIEDAVERTASVNRSWSNKIRNRWYARRRQQVPQPTDPT